MRAYHLHCCCGSHFEYAHTVYKCALNKFSFIRLRRRHTHQADNLAKLRQEFLFVFELIAKIFCAVAIARTSEALGNAQPRVAVASAQFEQLRLTKLFAQ